MRSSRLVLWSIVCVALSPSHAQTTQGIITGRVVDSRSGAPLPAARILYRNTQTSENGVAAADPSGLYSMPSLPPGTYIIRAESPDYQAREIQSLELNVAARLEIDFSLRPLREALQPGDYNSDLLPGAEAILPVIGPDLEAGRSAPVEVTEVQSAIRQPSLSYVVDPRQISEAPLSARNVYALITTLPGVSAAQVTGRGLQITANGQRASASNYLLDGVQNNDFLNTGPFSPTAPEAIQEYRVSTNNYSVEYGQTGGFIANAVTKAGGDVWHGEIYSYLDNQAIDANTFQNNASGQTKNPFKQLYLGYSAGGPIVRDRLFFSSSFEHLRSRSRGNPVTGGIFLPGRLRQCLGASSSPILDLYDRFPLKNPANAVDLFPSATACTDFATYTYGPPVSEDRSLAVERLDYRSPSGANRMIGRVIISRATQPDFVFSVYQGLSEKLTRDSNGLLLSYVRSFGPNLFNDLRFSWSTRDIGSLRPHPEIPVLQYQYQQNSFLVPAAGSPLDFGMKGGQYEVAEGLTWTRGHHVITAGGGVLLRRPQYLLSYLGAGLYNFNPGPDFASNTKSFAEGRAIYYELPISRPKAQNGQLAPLPTPSYDQYSNNQFSGYLNDNIMLTRRLAINLGVRYESYGSLLNETTPRGFLQLGAGPSIDQRLAAASPDLLFAKQSAYRPARNNWAGRFGVSYSPWSRMALRAGFGIFYDRPFDNLFLDIRNNTLPLTNSVTGQDSLPAVLWNQPINFQQSIAQLLQSGKPTFVLPGNLRTPAQIMQQQVFFAQNLDSRTLHSDPLEMLWIDQNLRSPRVQSWFAAVQQQVTNAFYVEMNTSGALARKLITNDVVNRLCSVACSAVTPVRLGRLNPNFPDILYRSNSGSSDYAALGFLARYRTSRSVFQLAYTYSHSIDNQSDPLLSDVFNLAFTNPDTVGSQQGTGIFTRQFDSRADRANSDFDIRHNLVFYSIWDLPAVSQAGWLGGLSRNWTFAQVAAVRSGLPYTLYSFVLPPSSGGILAGPRLDVVPGVSLTSCAPAPACTPATGSPTGGKQLINRAAVRAPGPGQIGSLGRNSLPGPGFWNVDLSLKRSFKLAPLGEAGKIEASVSAFNAFNHSNLGFPSIFSGYAQYGPTQNQAEFPAALPEFPSPRRVQFQLKVVF